MIGATGATVGITSTTLPIPPIGSATPMTGVGSVEIMTGPAPRRRNAAPPPVAAAATAVTVATLMKPRRETPFVSCRVIINTCYLA